MSNLNVLKTVELSTSRETEEGVGYCITIAAVTIATTRTPKTYTNNFFFHGSTNFFFSFICPLKLQLLDPDWEENLFQES